MKTIVIGKKYRLRRRGQTKSEWIMFRPDTWIASQRAWWGESETYDMVLFERELDGYDVVELPADDRPRCDCGGVKANTTHALWCSAMG